MKYWIIALISFVTSVNCCFARIFENDFTISSNDSSQKMTYLKLEYTIFTAQSDEEKYDALMQKAMMSAQVNDLSKMLYEINRMDILDENLKIRKAFYITVETLLFNQGLYNSCLAFIQKDTLEAFNTEKSFMKVLCLNQEQQYDLMLQELRQSAFYLNKDTSVIFREIKDFNVKSNEKKSTLLQAFIPGTGMMNEGEIKEGFTSLLLNGIFITVPVLLVTKEFYFSAFTYGLMPFTKFYGGGIKHTKYLAEKNREKKVAAIKQKNAKLLLEFYLNQ